MILNAKYLYRAVIIQIAFTALPLVAQTDSTHLIHRIAVDVVPGTIIHTNRFLKGENPEERTMNHAFSVHLKYAFQQAPNSKIAQIYKGAYQGVGVGWAEFNPQLGHPVTAYLFQGARIATVCPRLTFNYEWNLGLAMGWNPYNADNNVSNLVIGSKVTAYINADFYLAYRLSRQIDLNVGASVTHYSNGNTKFPNAGLNTAGIRAGLAYYINRPATEASFQAYPSFAKGLTCDVLLYGAWHKRGMYSHEGGAFALPGTFGVVGFNINPMYNVNHWLNVGLSVDGVYDEGANLHVIGDPPYESDDVEKPNTNKQMAMGLSARTEFVMPYFTINLGVGMNVVNRTSDFKGLYEVLALKINMSRRVFAHIGYTLNDFRSPRHLMLGMGYRFGKPRR